MATTYPAAAATVCYFPVNLVCCYSGSPTSTLAPITVKSGNHPCYFTAYKACRVYKAAISVVDNNSTACSLTFQPWGNLTSAQGTATALGSNQLAGVNVPTSGPFVTYSVALAINLSANGYCGMAVSSTNTSAVVWINVTLWISQAGL